MEFKYDTKPTYQVITPITDILDAKLTEALHKEISESTDATNFLIDLENCKHTDSTSFSQLANLHEYCYTHEKSLVFTAINNDILQELKKSEIDTIINIAPTQIEAVDIISMEILERDLFNEDE